MKIFSIAIALAATACHPVHAATISAEPVVTTDALGYTCVQEADLETAYATIKAAMIPQTCTHNPCSVSPVRADWERDIVGVIVKATDEAWDSYYAAYAQYCRDETVPIEGRTRPKARPEGLVSRDAGLSSTSFSSVDLPGIRSEAPTGSGSFLSSSTGMVNTGTGGGSGASSSSFSSAPLSAIPSILRTSSTSSEDETVEVHTRTSSTYTQIVSIFTPGDTPEQDPPDVTIAPVPVPASALLLLAGLFSLTAMRKGSKNV